MRVDALCLIFSDCTRLYLLLHPARVKADDAAGTRAADHVLELWGAGQMLTPQTFALELAGAI